MSRGLLLDTVVVSELRKNAQADPAVRAWQHSAAGLPAYLSVITLLEIRQGLCRVRARDPAFAARLETWYRQRLLAHFSQHLLPVDQAVAEAAARIGLQRTLPRNDALIAATALVHDLAVVTRNVADFADTGVPVINPWTA